MPFVEINFDDIVFDPNVYSYCNNSKLKCPNFDHNWACPPASPYLENKISEFRKFYLAYEKFDLNAEVNNARLKHPKRTEKRIVSSIHRKNYLKNNLENGIIQFLEKNGEKFEENFVIWPSSCKICFNKKDKSCTYDSGGPCRYPDKIKYGMTAAGINTTETAKKINVSLEWPPVQYSYQFALVCFK